MLTLGETFLIVSTNFQTAFVLFISYNGLEMLKVGGYFPEHELIEMTNSQIFIEASFCVWSGKENPNNTFLYGFPLMPWFSS